MVFINRNDVKQFLGIVSIIFFLTGLVRIEVFVI